MNGKKLSAALLILTIISIIVGAFHYNMENPLEIASVPVEMEAQPAAISCINPSSIEELAACGELEEQILAATVRIEMHSWATFGGHQKAIITKSHATILYGATLVTHNHYKYSLTEQVEAFGEVRGYTAISLRDSSGQLILENADMKSFSIVHEDPETLLLAFVDENGQGLFEAKQLPSAEFAAIEEINLETGTELAQIDWDGESAHVDWVNIDNLSLDNVIPQLQVNNFPKKGCSGGGVFWNGIHIGNNWAKNFEEDPQTDEITRRYSIIALNTTDVVRLAE